MERCTVKNLTLQVREVVAPYRSKLLAYGRV